MNFLKIQIQYSLLLCLVCESAAELPDDLFIFPIHSLFEVVTSNYERTLIGLTTYRSSFPFQKNYTINFLPSASNSLSGDGTVSFYGKDAILVGKNTFDYGLHKLFYKKDWGKVTFSTGIGYDFDGVNETYVDEKIKTTENRIFESHKTLSIKKWTENSVYANVNGTFQYGIQKWLLFGVEMVHTIKGGLEYVEQAENTLNSFREYNDLISYYNYDNDAYKNRLTFGAGLLKEFLSKRGYERALAAYLIYERSREHSDLSLLEGVRSYFNYWEPDNIQFSGKDNHSNSIALACALTERDPYKIYFNRKWNAHFQAYLKSADLEIKIAEIFNKTVSANQWNFNSTFYGVTERVSTQYPLTIHGEFLSELMIFSFFNLRLDSDLNGTIERISKNEINSRCLLTLRPYIGFSIPVQHRLLIDIHYSPINSSVGFISAANSFRFGFDMSFLTIFQLRLSLMKGYYK